MNGPGWRYHVKTLLYNDRWREQMWIRRFYYLFWDWIFRKWDQWVYPHLRPRTWFRKEYEHLVLMRVPEVVRAYVWGGEDPDYGPIGAIHYPHNDHSLCCFGGWLGSTEDDVREGVEEFLSYYAEKAGTIGDGWTVEWFDHAPPDHTESPPPNSSSSTEDH